MRSLLPAFALAPFAVPVSVQESAVTVISDHSRFESGQIYNGENGKTYTANISLQPDGKLRLRGYVGSPMFGETQFWTRVSQ